MSAVLTRRRQSGRGRERDGYRQASLFGQVVAPPPLERTREDEPAREAPEPAGVATLTLDAAITALWSELQAGDAATCPACGEDLEPQRSPAGDVLGGRCTGCASALA
jgi:hypothetical protein